MEVDLLSDSRLKNPRRKVNSTKIPISALIVTAIVIACCLLASASGSSIKRRRNVPYQGMGRSRYRFPVHYDVVKRAEPTRYMDPLMRARDFGPEDVDKGLEDERELQEFLKEMEENDHHGQELDDSDEDDDDSNSKSEEDEEERRRKEDHEDDDEDSSDNDDNDSEEDEDKKRKKRPWVGPGVFATGSGMPYVALPDYSNSGPESPVAHPQPAAIVYGMPRFGMMRSGAMDRRRRMLAGKKRGFTVSDVYAQWHRLPPSVKYEPYKYHHGLLPDDEEEEEDDDRGRRPSGEDDDEDEEEELKKRFILKRKFALPIFTRHQPDSEEIMNHHHRDKEEYDDDKKKRLAIKRKFAAPFIRHPHDEEDEEDEKMKRTFEMSGPRDRRDPPPLPMGGNKFSDYFGFDKRKKREAIDNSAEEVNSTEMSTTEAPEEYYSDSNENDDSNELIKRKKRSREGAMIAAHRRQGIIDDWMRRRAFEHLRDNLGRNRDDESEEDEEERKKRVLMIKRGEPRWMKSEEEAKRLRWRNGKDKRVMLKKRFGKMLRFGDEEHSDEDNSCIESDEEDENRKKRTCFRKKLQHADRRYLNNNEDDDDNEEPEDSEEEDKRKRFIPHHMNWQEHDEDEDQSQEDDSEEEEKKKRTSHKESEEASEELDEELSQLADDIMGQAKAMDRSKEVYPISELEDRLEAVDMIKKIQGTLRDREESESQESDEDDNEEDDKKKKKRGMTKRSLPHLFPATTPQFLKKNQPGGEQECPALENILDGCVEASKMAGDHELRFVDACNLHELCSLCGEGFRLLSSEDCDNIFMDKMEEVCPGGEPGCLEKSYRMAVAVDKLNPGGEEDPNQCYQESCVTKILKHEFGDLIPFKK